MTSPKIEAVAWMVGDEAFRSASLAIEEIQQWGPSGSIAKPVYSQQTVDALLAEVERLRSDRDSWCQQASDRVADWDEMRRRAERAEAQAEADRRDAERYRVWRLQAVTGSMPDHICEMMIRARTEADVDAAIDASMPAAGIAQ